MGRSTNTINSFAIFKEKSTFALLWGMAEVSTPDIYPTFMITLYVSAKSSEYIVNNSL